MRVRRAGEDKEKPNKSEERSPQHGAGMQADGKMRAVHMQGVKMLQSGKHGGERRSNNNEERRVVHSVQVGRPGSPSPEPEAEQYHRHHGRVVGSLIVGKLCLVLTCIRGTRTSKSRVSVKLRSSTEEYHYGPRMSVSVRSLQ
jgi:hypothetical protein